MSLQSKYNANHSHMKPQPPIPIQRLATAFSAGLLAAVLLLSALALWQVFSVAEHISLSRQQAAQYELVAAVERQLRRTQAQAQRLANWSETKDQLHVIDGIALWSAQRVHAAGKLDSPHARVGLYHAHGHRFDFGNGQAGMPERLALQGTDEQTQAWLVGEAGQLVLYQPFTVFSQETPMTLYEALRARAEPQTVRVLLGHGLIRLDVSADLRARETFRFADLSGLEVLATDGLAFAPSALLQQTRIKTLGDASLQQFYVLLVLTIMLVLLLLASGSWLAHRFLQRMLVGPLSRITREIDLLRACGTSTSVQEPEFSAAPPPRIAELAAVRSALHQYHEEIQSLQHRLQHQSQRFRDLAYQDGLTGSLNRRAFDEDWSALLAQAKQEPQAVGFMLFDCNRFKAINDTYGHAVGDAVLIRIAAALQAALRSQDRLYRLGGDEFAMVLVAASPEQVQQVAQRCQEQVRARDFSDLELAEPVTVSIGLAHCAPEHNVALTELPRQADIAMYQAKRPGMQAQGYIAFYQPDADLESTLPSSNESKAVQLALSQPQLIELHYQPVYDLASGQVHSFEVLARLRHEGALLAPGRFMPVVAHRRQEVEFDLAVLDGLEAQLQRGALPDAVGLALNLSAASVVDAAVQQRLLALARSHGTGRQLTVEITETALVTQIEQARERLQVLRQAGFRIAMDDFGTGYSPLRYLLDLPIDVIKLDMSLTQALTQGERSAQLVCDLVRILKNAGYSIVAEGVEQTSQLIEVRNLGINYAQGYLLGRPELANHWIQRLHPLAGIDLGLPVAVQAAMTGTHNLAPV